MPVEAMEKVCNVPSGSHVAPFGEEELLLSLTFCYPDDKIESKKEKKNVTSDCIILHAICSYKERWDFSTTGSSLFLPRFSLLTFFKSLGSFFIFYTIFFLTFHKWRSLYILFYFLR